jgi:four helix bundle protein
MKTQNKAGEEVNKGFEDLKAWQLARQLMIGCHELANRLPAFERHDLVSQIRRSSKSVMANIAEGYGRYHYLDSLRFYYIARGSLTETISHLITAHDLKYTGAEQHQTLYDLSREAERTLNGYINFTWKQQQGRNHYGERYIADVTSDTLPTAKPDGA